jgi:hypothetical protein
MPRDIVTIGTAPEGAIIAMVDGPHHRPVISDRVYMLGRSDPSSGRVKAWHRWGTGLYSMLHPSGRCVIIPREPEWRF